MDEWVVWFYVEPFTLHLNREGADNYCPHRSDSSPVTASVTIPLPVHVNKALLPTTREGNVFTGVCHSVRSRPHGYSFSSHPCYGAVSTHPTGMLSCCSTVDVFLTVHRYTSEAPEMQMRRMADLAFMFQLYEIAYQTYHTAKRDFNNDHAWLYYAGALVSRDQLTHSLFINKSWVHNQDVIHRSKPMW